MLGIKVFLDSRQSGGGKIIWSGACERLQSVGD